MDFLYSSLEAKFPQHPLLHSALVFARSTPIFDLSPHSFLLCSHTLTHCPICKRFVLITLQQYGGAPNFFPIWNRREVRRIPGAKRGGWTRLFAW